MRDALGDGQVHRAALNSTPITIAGAGEQQRNPVFVEDLADAHVRALAPPAADETLALGGGTRVSVAEIADTVCSLVRPVQLRHEPARAASRRCQRVGISTRLAEEVAAFGYSRGDLPLAYSCHWTGWRAEISRQPGRAVDR